MSAPLSILPSAWHLTRLDRVATVNARIGWKALTAAEYQPDGYAFLSTPNIKGVEIDFENVNYITEFRYRESPDLQLREGDVLLTKDGFTLGTVNVVTQLPRPATVNGSVAVLRPFGIDSHFLRYVLASSAIQHHMWAAKNGMDVLHLFQRDIKKIPLPLPPVDEQRRIADFLDTETARIDTLATTQRQLISKLKEREAASIELILSEVASHHVRLKNLLISPPSYGANESAEHDRRDWPRYIRTTDIAEDGSLRDSTFASLPPHAARNYMLDDGDLLFVRSGATVGKSFVYRSSFGPAAHAGYLIRARVDTSRLDSRLIWHFCQTRSYWQQVSEGTTQATIQNVNAEKYGNLLVPMVSHDQQGPTLTRLDRTVAKSRSLRNRAGRLLDLLAERRQAVITAAVTGQFDVSTASGRNVTDGVNS
ncbi:restriction endonuclease subunit S [Streptomyces atroolivaceus]|uniref:restriction endonuclease subunit S n=1 Tax=Streptomyces atroolivaceus TaxID=66869 RepID=UPI0037BB6326